MLVQHEVVHVLNRSRAFVVITGGNAADHSIVVGIVGERVLLSLLSYCYLFVIVMPVSVPCCRWYHVWNTLLPKDTFLSAIIENLKKQSNKKLLGNFLTHTRCLTNERGFLCFTELMYRVSGKSIFSVLPSLRIASPPPDPKWPPGQLSADCLCWWSFHRMPSFGWLQSDLPEKLWVVV